MDELHDDPNLDLEIQYDRAPTTYLNLPYLSYLSHPIPSHPIPTLILKTLFLPSRSRNNQSAIS